MMGFNKKKGQQSRSEDKTNKKSSSQLSQELIEKLAYYNHLRYPHNSDLDNWYLALKEYESK